MVDLGRALLDPLHAGVDQTLDFFGCFGRASGQGAHLAGHHGKATPLVTGAGRFHRSVQGQDVGLEGDAVDDADDVGDLAGGIVDTLHGFDHQANNVTALDCNGAGVHGQLIGLFGAVGVLLDGGAKLLHRGRGLLQRTGLLLGAGGEIVVTRGNLGGGGGHALGSLAHGGDHARQGGLHTVHGRQHAAGVTVAHMQLGHQITIGDAADGIAQFSRLGTECPGQAAGDKHTGDHCRCQNQETAEDEVVSLCFVICMGRFYQLGAPFAGVVVVLCRDLDQGGQQGAALAVHFGDGFVAFLV